MNILIAAGGTGGHIFPALSVAQEFRKKDSDISLLWIGSSRSRENELCAKYDIPLKIIDVIGMKRKLSLSLFTAIRKFIQAVMQLHGFMKQSHPDAVIAFGGYVCAPVLLAARLNRIPYFLQEQNSVPGVVNRFFAKGAKCSFLGYPLEGKWKLQGKSEVTGNPVRTVTNTVDNFVYPKKFDKQLKTILICGGSQGAVSMNDCLMDPVKDFLEMGLQVVWQTGDISYKKIKEHFSQFSQIFVFASLDDLYPYYAAAQIIICRSGASTLSEVAYFGLPCIMIPLPWSAENHQWMNAGHVEHDGWGIRVKQNEQCGKYVIYGVQDLIVDEKRYERMCQKALDYSPTDAATHIVQKVVHDLKDKQ